MQKFANTSFRRYVCVCLDFSAENLTPAGDSVNRVTLNSSDRELAEGMPLLKEALHPSEPELIPCPEQSQVCPTTLSLRDLFRCQSLLLLSCEILKAFHHM